MTQVRIEMDEGWRWWPDTVPAQTAMEDAMGLSDETRRILRRPMTLDVPDEMLARYKRVYAEYRQLQTELEQLYRVQEGLTPWDSDPVPEHKVL